jgi:hypothetical protein
MKNPQAKDIRKMLGANSSRYDYLASRFGIIPEVEEVTGRGRGHIYSFRNALQFAIADRISRFGFAPRQVKKVLNSLEEPKYLSWPHDRDVRDITIKRIGEYFSEDVMEELFMIIVLGIAQVQQRDEEESAQTVILPDALGVFFFPDFERVSDFISSRVLYSVQMLVDLAMIKRNVIDFLESGKMSTWG